MKRSLAILLLLGLVILSSCDYNAPLRNKMIEHYSDESNYETFTGTIVKIEQNSLLTVEILSSSKGSAETIDGPLEFECSLNHSNVLAVGDTITFTATLAVFYNGHKKPMLSVEKDGVVLESLEEGKESYLKWIEKTFD